MSRVSHLETHRANWDLLAVETTHTQAHKLVDRHVYQGAAEQTSLHLGASIQGVAPGSWNHSRLSKNAGRAKAIRTSRLDWSYISATRQRCSHYNSGQHGSHHVFSPVADADCSTSIVYSISVGNFAVHPRYGNLKQENQTRYLR